MLTDLAQDLLDFVYPRLCYVCEATLPRGVSLKCPKCQHQLVISDMHLRRYNEVTDRLAGRLDLVFGAAMYRFYKGGVVQKMVHRWKYGGYREIGGYLGEEYGRQIRNVPLLDDLDGIIPVPLHPARYRWRGYNQAETFADGLAAIIGVPVRNDWVIRRSRSASQTKKGREQRLISLMESFSWKRPGGPGIRSGHFLLVDDILTTGATIEAFARPFLELPSVRLSLVTVALGQK